VRLERARPAGAGDARGPRAGQGKDTATSFGPWLVTPDELEDRRKGKGFELTMTASVNGTTYTTGNLADLHWSFEQMISFASRGTELRTDDVIGSGMLLSSQAATRSSRRRHCSRTGTGGAPCLQRDAGKLRRSG
jgi:2-keto-4-pentenoate hydratase/2-oxohepta-3-ene-1,7-dioic acid hydratase in catechol pathway